MTTRQSGLIIVGVGIGMNLVGRVVPKADTSSLVLATLYALWMVASEILVLFGCYRTIAGGFRKK